MSCRDWLPYRIAATDFFPVFKARKTRIKSRIVLDIWRMKSFGRIDFLIRESRENPYSRLYIFIGWMNIYIFYKIDHIVIIILVDIFAPEALTKTELCDIILYIMALLSEAFIALEGCRFCKKKKKQPAICESRVPQKEKRNAFRAAFNGKMFCLFRGSCNCPERKMQKEVKCS